MLSSLSFNKYLEPNSHETINSISKHSLRLIPTEFHAYLLLSSHFPYFSVIYDLDEGLPVPLKAINDNVQQYQHPYWPLIEEMCQQLVTSWTSCWCPWFYKLSGLVFPPNFQPIHPVHIFQLTVISPQCHCFHLFLIFVMLQENWKTELSGKTNQSSSSCFSPHPDFWSIRSYQIPCLL